MTDVMEPDVQMRGDLLVVTLHNSINPVIWQMDRARFRTAAFDVLQRPSAFVVRFKPLDGTPMDIAEYTDRADALAVLKSIQQVLANATGMPPRGRLKVDAVKPRTQHMILAAVSVLLFVVLGSVLFRLVPPPLDGTAHNITETTSMPEPGVPQSADDVFKNQESR